MQQSKSVIPGEKITFEVYSIKKCIIIVNAIASIIKVKIYSFVIEIILPFSQTRKLGKSSTTRFE